MSQYLWLLPHFPPCSYPQPLPPWCWALLLPFPNPDPNITWAILATCSLGSWFSSWSLDSRCSLCSLSHYRLLVSSHGLVQFGPFQIDPCGYPLPCIHSKPPRPHLGPSMSSLSFHQIPSKDRPGVSPSSGRGPQHCCCLPGRGFQLSPCLLHSVLSVLVHRKCLGANWGFQVGGELHRNGPASQKQIHLQMCLYKRQPQSLWRPLSKAFLAPATTQDVYWVFPCSGPCTGVYIQSFVQLHLRRVCRGSPVDDA